MSVRAITSAELTRIKSCRPLTLLDSATRPDLVKLAHMRSAPSPDPDVPVMFRDPDVLRAFVTCDIEAVPEAGPWGESEDFDDQVVFLMLDDDIGFVVLTSSTLVVNVLSLIERDTPSARLPSGQEYLRGPYQVDFEEWRYGELGSWEESEFAAHALSLAEHCAVAEAVGRRSGARMAALAHVLLTPFTVLRDSLEVRSVEQHVREAWEVLGFRDSPTIAQLEPTVPTLEWRDLGRGILLPRATAELYTKRHHRNSTFPFAALRRAFLAAGLKQPDTWTPAVSRARSTPASDQPAGPRGEVIRRRRSHSPDNASGPAAIWRREPVDGLGPTWLPLDVPPATELEALGGRIEHDRRLVYLQLGDDVAAADAWREPGPLMLSLLGSELDDSDFRTRLAERAAQRPTGVKVTNILDEQLIALTAIGDLQCLELRDGGLSDVALATLGLLGQLRCLDAALSMTDFGLDAIRMLPHLRSLGLSRSSVTDLALSQLKTLETLRYLDLDETAVSDEGLLRVARLTGLEFLSLERTEISDVGLGHLAPLIALAELRLGRTKITNAGLEGLGGLTRLRHLDLSDTCVTDVRRLALLPNLTELTLDRTPITAASCTILGELIGLRKLRVTGTGVDAGILAPLARLRQLDTLSLQGSKLGGAGVETLSGLTALRSLNLACACLSDSDLSHLASLPCLAHVDLSFNGVGDVGLRSFGSISLRSLRAQQTGTTGHGLAGFSALRELDLRASRVNDGGLATISTLSGLRKLDAHVRGHHRHELAIGDAAAHAVATGTEADRLAAGQRGDVRSRPAHGDATSCAGLLSRYSPATRSAIRRCTSSSSLSRPRSRSQRGADVRCRRPRIHASRTWASVIAPAGKGTWATSERGSSWQGRSSS